MAPTASPTHRAHAAPTKKNRHHRGAWFHPTTPQIGSVTTHKSSPWLFGIAFNVARNFTRGLRRREAYLEYDSEPQAEAWRGTPEELLCHRQRQDLLAELLAALPLEHRTTFVLFELEGLNGNEIAEQMQVPVGTVRSRLHHARKYLETALTNRAEADRLAAALVP